MRSSDTRYLLRVWRDGDAPHGESRDGDARDGDARDGNNNAGSEGAGAWRASLQSLRSRKTHYFRDLNEMVRFLEGAAPDATPPAEADEK